MKALVVIAHGSRNPLANEELQQMIQHLSLQPENRHFDCFKAGYLELASPSINDCLDELIAKNVTEFVIFPYFLNSGAHVLKDIPKAVTHYQTTYPDHQFTLLTHFGAAPGILDLVAQLVGDNAQ